MRPPTFDEYLTAAHRLASMVKRAFDRPGSVKRPQLREALDEFERVERAMRR